MSVPNELVEPWHEPVYVQVEARAPQIIHNPAEALEFLANDWVGSRRKHSFAREICSAAVRNQISSDTAREAFLQAVLDARINTRAPDSQQ